ncbi:Esterase PHB depolymerase [Sulfidibacter corallicola]|uniref:Peptidase S9 prolyl oligopeptidase catalytic domain-containing protein n=1 Tax=Sulfidibacter corallicola TaxID=2818388 RepID=A0A8A4TRK7_SULCO|nr:hypothetical protein [Sulfidibacter corallicola]QTD51712.1 hypothetical protein J3U87_04510 [Sulfidibacter corallicola]
MIPTHPRSVCVPWSFVLCIFMVFTTPRAAAQIDPIADSTPGTLITRKQNLVYRLFDDGAATAAAPRPLIVFLHGLGEKGTDNQRQVEAHIQPLIDHLGLDPDEHGYLVVPQSQNGWWQGESVGDLAQFLIQDERLHIDPERVYVTGLSAGGHGTYASIAESPETFAAGVPLSAPQNKPAAPGCAQRPMWLIHGDNDGKVGHGHSLGIKALIEQHGGTPRYTEVAGQGHGGWANVYRENPHYVGHFVGGDPNDPPTTGLYDWLYSQSLDASQRPAPLAPGESVSIDLGYFNNNQNPDNETLAPDDRGRTWANVVRFHAHAFDSRLAGSANGTPTALSLYFPEGFLGHFGSGTTGGVLVPDSAGFDGMFMGSRNGHDEALGLSAPMVIGGLTPGATYEIAIYGSANGTDGNRGRLNRYTIGNEWRDLDTADNTDREAIFEEVTADAAGKITVYVGVSPEGSARYAQVNALRIERLDGQPNRPMLREGRSMLVDFGAPSVVTPAVDDRNRHWNNVTDTHGAPQRPALENAVDDTGAATGVRIDITDPFEGRNGAGVNTSGPYPISAQRDTLWAGKHAGHDAGLASPAAIRIGGLEPGGEYLLRIFASRKGADGALDRLTRYEVDGQVRDFDVTDNTDTTVDFASVFADAQGSLDVHVSVSPLGTGRFCYLGGIQLTAIALD